MKQTKLTDAIHQISEMLHRRSMVMVFTDMISDSESLDTQFDAFKHLKYNKHEIVLFHLSDPDTELTLEFDNKPYNFVDVESGEKIKLNPSQYKEHYKKQAKEYLNKLKLKCLQYKIDLVEVDINNGFDQILTSYLIKRKKMF